VFLVEEGDNGLVTVGGHRDAEWLNDLMRRMFDGATAVGAMNAYLGRTLPGLVIDAGLELLGGEVQAPITRPGEPCFEFQRLTLEAARPALRTSGLLDEESATRADLGGDTRTVLTPVSLVSVWGRRAD
jgi:hypothetical protein